MSDLGDGGRLMPARRKARKKLRTPEWQVSSFMMDRALEAVVRQISKLDRNHDIPYLAGYSRNAKTIYIDLSSSSTAATATGPARQRP